VGKTELYVGKKEKKIVSRYKREENKVLTIKKYLRKINFKGDKTNYRDVTGLKRGLTVWNGDWRE
jgi:hypothetical protein